MIPRLDLDDSATSRWLSLPILLVTGVVLIIAVMLEPSLHGHGTHTQLGLNQCSVLEWTGYPCPMCGMTTSFALMVRARVFQALATQPMGVVFCVLTIFMFVVALMESIRPRLRWGKLWKGMVRFEGRIVVLCVVGLLAAWVYKMWSMGIFA